MHNAGASVNAVKLTDFFTTKDTKLTKKVIKNLLFFVLSVLFVVNFLFLILTALGFALGLWNAAGGGKLWVPKIELIFSLQDLWPL